MEILIGVVIVALVAAWVLVPFRAAGQGAVVATDDPELADLEARKQAKYREIRDTELDRAQGKLTKAEFKRQQAELRAEAIEILKRIDAYRESRAAGERGDGDRPPPARGEAAE